MRAFATLGKRKVVLGMIHLQPLPGTLFYKEGSFHQTLDTPSNRPAPSPREGRMVVWCRPSIAFTV